MLNTALANEVTPAGYIHAFVIAAFLAVSLTAAGGASFAIAGDGALLATAMTLVVVSPVSPAWVWFALRGAVGPVFGTLITAVGLVVVEYRNSTARITYR